MGTGLSEAIHTLPVDAANLHAEPTIPEDCTSNETPAVMYEDVQLRDNELRPISPKAAEVVTLHNYEPTSPMGGISVSYEPSSPVKM